MLCSVRDSKMYRQSFLKLLLTIIRMKSYRMNGKSLEESQSAIIYPKTCISINLFSFKIDNKYERSKVFVIIHNLLLSIFSFFFFFNFSTISGETLVSPVVFSLTCHATMYLSVKSIFRAMNIFLPRIPWIYLFPGATRVPIANSIPFHSHRKCTHNTVRSFA